MRVGKSREPDGDGDEQRGAGEHRAEQEQFAGEVHPAHEIAQHQVRQHRADEQQRLGQKREPFADDDAESRQARQEDEFEGVTA